MNATTSESGLHAPHRKLRCWKKAVFAVVAVCLFFGAVELLLGLVFRLSASSDQGVRTSPSRDAPPRPTSDYPANPDEYIKVAVFGGSAAAGAYASRSFIQIVAHEFYRRFPNQKFYFKNYAQVGYPFHRHQAEHVKLLIDKFDVFLIYCGNNEAVNWFDDNGYWRTPQYKHAKELAYQRPVEADQPLLQTVRFAIEQHSNLYALLRTTKGRIAGIELPPAAYRVFDYAEFEQSAALPPAAKRAIVSNFEQDLAAICELAEKHNKQVLISVSATHETFPPHFSCFRRDITDDEKASWQRLYQQGRDEFDKQRFENAISSFLKARNIDSSVAVLNHRLGISHLKQGDAAQGRRYLRQAIDQDGYYSRSITPLHRAAKKLSEKYNHLHYVDTVAAFHRVMEDELNDDDLFSDTCHPSFLGQVVIGHLFVNKLLELELFRSRNPHPGRNIAETDWKALTNFYFEEFAITNAERAQAAVNQMHWYFDMARWSSDPQPSYKAIEKLIERFEDNTDGSPSDRVFVKVSRGRVAVAREDYAQAVRLLNEAQKISPKAVEEALSGPAIGGFVRSEFQSAGIEFAPRQGMFVRTR